MKSWQLDPNHLYKKGDKIISPHGDAIQKSDRQTDTYLSGIDRDLPFPSSPLENVSIWAIGNWAMQSNRYTQFVVQFKPTDIQGLAGGVF